MANILTAHAKSHLQHVISGLITAGWTIEAAPKDGLLNRNGQKMYLRSGQADIRFRLFVYKVTESSRGKPEERRIEITSTYGKNLTPLRGYPDVVLGYDYQKEVFVGLDPKRIRYGGPTHNASSFFDRDGLDLAKRTSIVVLQRQAELFTVEYHAFITPIRLAEYFYNRQDIHSGRYAGDGTFSGSTSVRRAPTTIRIGEAKAMGDVLSLRGPESPQRRRIRVERALIEAVESQRIKVLRKRKITPEEFLEIKHRMEENGKLGEEIVLRAERKRLRRAGRGDLAERIRQISRESVNEGFDILSFETAGAERYIEVKATTGRQRSFDISANEWNKCQSVGDAYYVYFLTDVRKNPRISRICNPSQLEQEGRIRKTSTGWRVALL